MKGCNGGNINQQRRGRRSAENIVNTASGQKGQAKNIQTLLDAWELFISDQILIPIVDATNAKISNFRTLNTDKLNATDKMTHCKNTDLVELKAMLGIMYLRGAKRLNLTSSFDCFHHESALDVFSATMQHKRFAFLRCFMEFDEKDTRADRWKYDKFACFRDFFEAVNERNAFMRTPSEHLSIDETLYPYRGRIGFKQYNPSKPAKYGLLFRSLCDAAVQYTYFTLPYAGKPDSMNSNPANKYYITGTDEYSKYLITNLSRLNSIQGRNISLDRYFTSVTLARWCLEKKITLVGTMHHDRKGMPAELKPVAHREDKSVVHVHAENDNMILISWIDTKKSGKKNIILLSTLHDEIRVSRDQRRKPQPIVYYDHTKGGVDVVDLLSFSLSTRFKSKRWTLNALVFVLDTVRTNARTIFQEVTQGKISNFHFTWQLGMALVRPLIQTRYNNRNGLQALLINKISRVLDITLPALQQPAIEDNSGKLCNFCLKECHGPRYKELKRKLNTSVKSRCVKCEQTVCKKHCKFICETCNAPNN